MAALVLAGLGGLVAAGPAAAQSLTEPAWRAAFDGHREAELERLLNDRLTAAPADPAAWSALVRLARTSTDPARRKSLHARIDGCVQDHPELAACVFGAGALTWQEAGSVGLAVKGGRIRDALWRALEIDPTYAAARTSLVQFYLEAGRLAGGSVEKAGEVVTATPPSQAPLARLLGAMVDLHEGRLDAASVTLETPPPAGDRDAADLSRQLRGQLADAWIARKDLAKARALQEALAKEEPTSSARRLDLVRTLVSLKDYDAAAAQLDGMSRFPDRATLALDYRLGVVWQAKGDEGRARAAFMRFLAASGTKDPVQLDDALSRIAEMR
jgi:hypothetical protein